jgi:nucleoside-diphosphate-sugar epimerase
VKRYFVTGAQGFVGRYLIWSILESQSDAAVLGIGRSGCQNHSFTHCVQWSGKPIPAPLPPRLRIESSRYEYVAVNVHRRDHIAAMLQDFQPDVVVHLASGLRDDPISSLLTTNVKGTIDLLDAVSEMKEGVKKIILGSTGGVYGVPEKLPIDEQAVCIPIDLYSTTKLAAEHASRIMARQYGLPVIWARLFNLAGPGQDERHICGRFASQASAILEDLTPAVLDVESLDTTRDFVDVRDTASALITICEYGEPSSIYNVGSGNETSMQAILDITLEAAELRNRVTVRRKAGRIVDIPRHVASIDALRSLGFECRYTLDQTIRDVLDYYRTCVRGNALTAMNMAPAP